MPIQEIKTLYLPYSAVVKRRVKIGVVIMVNARWKTVHSKNAKPARTWTGSELNLMITFFIFHFV